MEPIASPEEFREQHKKRLSWMPWLYFTLKEKHLIWARPWQHAVQAALMAQETVELGTGCFISPDAGIFAQLGRAVRIGDGSAVAAHAFLHGPLTIGRNVSINARASLDGGAVGITVGDDTRIATGACLYAFDHQLEPTRLVREQPVRSRGIVVGKDVWIGAQAGVTDGVTVGDHAVVAMGAIVTHDVPEYAVVAGAPARVIGDRRDEKYRLA